MAEQFAIAPRTNGGELSSLLQRYYEDPCVRKRMCEFLGGSSLETATACYIAGTDGSAEYRLQSAPAALPEYLSGALEVDRSLWDAESLIADIDLEYHNFDQPAAAWLEPARALQLQQPVLDATLEILARCGIAPMTLVSGRGFHLLWAVPRKSHAFLRLAALGRVPPSLKARYALSSAPDGSSVDSELGRAFSGLSMILEYAGDEVLAASASTCVIPVEPAAIEVGPGAHGREIVSFDLSEYGDPLHTRHVRLPFSAYLKPRQFQWLLGEDGVSSLLPIFQIPLGAMTLRQAISVMRDPKAALEAARQGSTEIPNAAGAMDKLIDEYQRSELAEFHERFYRGTPERGAEPASLPPCVRSVLDQPNDSLLRPAALQHVVRVLMAIGWRPCAIADRICRSYSMDCGWDGIWRRLDPCNRAIFYTRLFAGMIATGVDQLIDLNCVSHKEKGYCTVPACSSNLATYRDRLLARRRA